MRTESTNVESQLRDSCKMWTEWRDRLVIQLNTKQKELRSADIAIDEIQHAIRLKSAPLQVALNRQNQRRLRPGVEQCLDKAQHALHHELIAIKSTLLDLDHQLG